MKMAFNVGADLRAAISWVYPGRRSEIGSYIFIGGGTPNWPMNNFHENPVLAATVNALRAVTVGLLVFLTTHE